MDYVLKLTKRHARVLMYATDLLARIGTGQWREMVDYLPITKGRDYTAWHKDLDWIGRLLSRYMIQNVDGWRSSLGIAHQQTPEISQEAWDIHQVIRHRLAWDDAVEQGDVDSVNASRDWSKMWGRSYDTPMHIAKEPLPEMESKTE